MKQHRATLQRRASSRSRRARQPRVPPNPLAPSSSRAALPTQLGLPLPANHIATPTSRRSRCNEYLCAGTRCRRAGLPGIKLGHWGDGGRGDVGGGGGGRYGRPIGEGRIHASSHSVYTDQTPSGDSAHTRAHKESATHVAPCGPCRRCGSRTPCSAPGRAASACSACCSLQGRAKGRKEAVRGRWRVGERGPGGEAHTRGG